MGPTDPFFVSNFAGSGGVQDPRWSDGLSCGSVTGLKVRSVLRARKRGGEVTFQKPIVEFD